MKTLWIASLAITACAGLALCTAADEPGPKPDELFQKLDENSDGKVTSDEVGEEQARFFERLVRIGDKDGNSQLTKEEFLEAFKSDDRPVGDFGRGPGFGGGGRGFGGGPGGGGPDGPPRREPGQIFEWFDANHDGKLSLDEMPAPMRERLQPMMDRMGKKELTPDDFAEALRRREFGPGPRRGNPNADRRGPDGDKRGPEAGGPPEGRRGGPRGPQGPDQGDFKRPGAGDGPQAGGRRHPRFFEILDANGDHQISKEELAKAADLIKQLDENGDGQLDPREVLGPPPGDMGRDQGPGPGRPDDRARRPDRSERPERGFRRPGFGRPGRPDDDRPRPPEGPDGQRPPRDSEISA